MHIKKLNEAANMTSTGHVLVITMEEGLAHLFLVTNQTSKLKAKIEKNIAKKKAFASKTDKQKIKFHELVE